MRLLFVHQYLGAMGGAETDLLLAARGLRQRGHDLALLYGAPTGRNAEAWREVFSSCHPLGRNGAGAVRDVLARFGPDAVYFHSLAELGPLEQLIDARLALVRRVHDHRMYCMRGYKYNYFTRAICNRPTSLRCLFPCLGFVGRNHDGGLPVKWVSYTAKLRELGLNRRCHRLLVYSEDQKQQLVRNGFEPGKVIVHVPLQIGGGTGEVSSLGARNMVLFVGQVVRGKGVDLLLRALSKVRVPFEGWILGDGNHRPYCERLSVRLGLSDRVRFHGFVPRDELKKFYLEASVLAVSSIWPEPFGLVGREAMSYGLPVVAFDAGGIREWLVDGENGFLVRWKDTDELAAHIEELLRDKELARRMGRRGLEMVMRQRESSREIEVLEALFSALIAEVRLASSEPTLRPPIPANDN
jgi:glycosyltransferase involved in cell wall biosynthesis